MGVAEEISLHLPARTQNLQQLPGVLERTALVAFGQSGMVMNGNERRFAGIVIQGPGQTGPLPSPDSPGVSWVRIKESSTNQLASGVRTMSPAVGEERLRFFPEPTSAKSVGGYMVAMPDKLAGRLRAGAGAIG